MIKTKNFIKNMGVVSDYHIYLEKSLDNWLIADTIKILIVIDGAINIVPGRDGVFGISTVIDFIRNTSVGCINFNVDIATREGSGPSINPAPTAYEAKYRGFRFDMSESVGADTPPVINRYDQIWCFGYNPGNEVITNIPKVDEDAIENPIARPASNIELAALSLWMRDRKGGLFGTGDHYFLGASMCHRIPRLGTMRRWTIADHVPPSFSPSRINTLRPPSAAYEPSNPGGPLIISDNFQADLVVQPVQWVPILPPSFPFSRKWRPHPVLSHPTLGPIDVMPDHMHEGLCVEPANINLNRNYNFDGGRPQPEYPDAIDGGAQPAPIMIAYGSNLGAPPYNFGVEVQDAQPARSQNPMISVYDGHRAGVGRVATDSTWHHWMNININRLKTENNDNWKKISRYYLNLAIWLQPPGFSTDCLHMAVMASHFQYPGFQEYSSSRTTLELGRSARFHLMSIYGPVWLSERIWEIVTEYKLFDQSVTIDENMPFHIDGIDPSILETLVLGHYVRATLEPAEAIKRAALGSKTEKITPLATPEKLFEEPLRAAMAELADGLAEYFAIGSKFVDSFAR